MGGPHGSKVQSGRTGADCAAARGFHKCSARSPTVPTTEKLADTGAGCVMPGAPGAGCTRERLNCPSLQAVPRAAHLARCSVSERARLAAAAFSNHVQ
jgi:hypothetical protein